MYTIVVKRKRNGRIITLSFLIAMLVLFILMGLNTDNPDRSYYEGLFFRAGRGFRRYQASVEVGFLFLVRITSQLGMNYSQFLMVYTTVGLALLGNSLILYTRKPTLAILCYICYPFFLDSVQIRHFMAVAIFVYATRYLMEFSTKNLLKYCSLILLASSQHLVAISFMLLLIVYIQDKRKAIYTSLIVMLLVFAGLKAIYNSSIVRAILGLRNVSYSSGIGNTQVTLYIVFYLFLAILCYLLYQFNRNRYGEHENEYSPMIKICASSVIFVPFIIIDYQFTRLFRGCIPIIYMYISNQISFMKKDNMMISTGILLVVMMLVSLKLFGPGSWYYKNVTLPLFSQNLLFNLLN